MSELKACPFCGQQPKKVIWREYGKKPRKYFLYHCPNEECPSYFTKPGSMTLEEWNTRPVEDKLQVRIADLVSANLAMSVGIPRLQDRIAELEAENKKINSWVDDLMNAGNQPKHRNWQDNWDAIVYRINTEREE